MLSFFMNIITIHKAIAVQKSLNRYNDFENSRSCQSAGQTGQIVVNILLNVQLFLLLL
jgi:hypothetical protein